MRNFVARFIGENNRLSGRIENIAGAVCDVRVGDALIQALRVAPGEVGDETILSIRPERVKLAPEPGLYHNEFEALIRDITFLGDHLRVTVSALGTTEFIVKIPNVVGHGAVIPGDRIRIGWTSTDCRALDHEPGSASP